MLALARPLQYVMDLIIIVSEALTIYPMPKFTVINVLMLPKLLITYNSEVVKLRQQFAHRPNILN
jgi:hypothetical protein